MVVGLLVLVLLFHWRLITPHLADRQSYPPGDFSHQFWAFSTFEARELSAGRLPLWNPYTYAGAPFWADVQSAVLYPFSLLTLGLSGLTAAGFSLFALELEAIFHFWLAGLFMYLLARRVTQSRGAALVAALVFAFGGYLTGYPSQQLAVLEVDVWLPLILFFLDRALLARAEGDSVVLLRTRPRGRDLVFAGGAWGLALLAGHPQSWMLVGYTFVAYFLFQVFRFKRQPSPDPQFVSRLLYLAIPVFVGFGLAAIQLLPAIEYTRLSVRAVGLYDKMAGGFPLTDAIQFLLPGVVSQYSPLFVGAVGLLLALAAIFLRRDRATTFWGIWGGMALLISFGGNTFLYAPLYLSVPGFSIFRGQERWAFVVAFSLALLAGYGYQYIEQWGRQSTAAAGRGQAAFARLVGWLTLGSVGLVVAFFYGLNDTGWSPESQFYQLLERAVFLMLILALFWGVIRVASKLSPAILISAVGALIVFELFSINWKTNLYPQRPEWHTQQPAAVRAIEQDAVPGELFRVYNEFRLYDNYGVPYALQDLWGASPLRLARYDAFLAPPMRIERAWELLNVKYVITWRKELYAPSTIIYQEPAADGTTYVHRLDDVGPRAWVVHAVAVAPAAEMVARMAAPDFDARRVALVDAATASRLATWFRGNGDDAVTEQATVTLFRPNQLEVQVTANSAGVLVLSEIAYPGWQATVDGVPASVERVDSILRAVPISAGAHTVRLVFRPRTFAIGALLSVLVLLASVVFVIIHP